MSLEDTPTTEQIARHYSASLDSVNLLNGGKPATMSAEEWTNCKKRNVDHLKIMVAKTYWTTESMSPLNTAISANE